MRIGTAPRTGFPSILSALVLSLALAGCHTPSPNDLVLLDVPGAPRFALSTEDGVVALRGDDLASRAIPAIQYWRGRETHDSLLIVQRSDDLVLLRPESARLTWSPFAARDIEPGDELFVQVIGDDFERLPVLIEGCWHQDGRHGDLFAVSTWFVDEEMLAARFAGAGVYVKRKGVYEIVGILNGTVATNPEDTWFGPDLLLPFLRLDAIAPVLPTNSNFFDRGPRTFRPDFEHGLSREGEETLPANRTDAPPGPGTRGDGSDSKSQGDGG
jgi:hypothetical protein